MLVESFMKLDKVVRKSGGINNVHKFDFKNLHNDVKTVPLEDCLTQA